MKEIKPGVKTTEGWITIIATIGGLIISVLQVVSPEQAPQAQTVLQNIVEVLKVALPILLPLVLGNQYITARTALKMNQSQ